MKKLALFISGLLVAMMGYSQKTVYVDTDYLLSKIPAYKEAQQQIDELTKNWQAEIEEQRTALDNMYKQYQVDKVLLSNDMKAKREQEILDKEKELKELQKKRFGSNGDRMKKEEELIKCKTFARGIHFLHTFRKMHLPDRLRDGKQIFAGKRFGRQIFSDIAA